MSDVYIECEGNTLTEGIDYEVSGNKITVINKDLFTEEELDDTDNKKIIKVTHIYQE
jgi:hypothetical protein